MPDLPQHFRETLAQVRGSDPGGELWEALAERHGQPDRHFHTLEELAFRLDLLAATGPDTAPLRLALYYHHAVHDPCGENNELQSARFAREELARAGVREQDSAIVYDLIRLTDPLPSPAMEHDDLFLDLHRAWLGTPPEQYEAFARHLREDVAWLPDGKYLRQRMNEVMPLLDRQPIYRTETFRERFEDQARANLTAEITRLRG